MKRDVVPEKNEKKDWKCEEDDAQFRWLVERAKEEDINGFDFYLDVPKTKKEWEEAELYTDAGMFTNEFYPASEVDDCCDACRKKLEKLGVIK